MEQIKSFFEKVKTDETLQAALKELAKRKADAAEVVALAKEKGFSFTKENFEAFVKENLPQTGLNEAQLSTVSGGIWKGDVIPPDIDNYPEPSIVDKAGDTICRLPGSKWIRIVNEII